MARVGMQHDSTTGGFESAAPHPHVDLILQQLESLPTLSSIAIRVLELTSDDDFKAKEVIQLIETDPALSAKVLKLCRCSEQGRVANVRTVDRAVIMLGFHAVRNAVLSVQMFETLEAIGKRPGKAAEENILFDRRAFWQHSIAVASASDSLANLPALRQTHNRSEAFLAGLLHDLGLLALHVTLPDQLEDAIRDAERNAISMDQACRRIIGVDTRTAGKRLAEHWRLPHALVDVIWLHGQQPDLLPDLPHRNVIALVSLADALVHGRYLAPVDHGRRCESTAALMQWLDLDEPQIEPVIAALPEQVKVRAEALGMSVEHDHNELMRALGKANAALGRINDYLRDEATLSSQQARIIASITAFHRKSSPGGSVTSALTEVARSAGIAFGDPTTAVIFQAHRGGPWHVLGIAADGRVMGNSTKSGKASPQPPGHRDLADFDTDADMPLAALNLFSWLKEQIPDLPAADDWRLLPLGCGVVIHAAVVHRHLKECPVDREQLDALSRTWAAAIMAAVQHDGARRLGEQLAQANAILGETQDELSRARALAAIGEVAAGAAHEMNNPLTIICGRAQLLTSRIEDESLRSMASQIADASHQLSDMITALRRLAEPLRLQPTSVNLPLLLDVAVQTAFEQAGREVPIELLLPEEQTLAHMHVDGQQFTDAVAELVRNAIESEGSSNITIRVQIDSRDDRLTLQVIDDGNGLTDHTLAHAFEPFFSAKPAGRQPGLGLARVRRIIEAHGGRVTLRNAAARGAVATIQLDHWRNTGKPIDVLKSSANAA